MAADGGSPRAPQGAPLYTGPLSKLHKAPSPELIRAFELIRDMSRSELEIAQKFSLEELAAIVEDFSHPHPVYVWADLCNNIALQFKSDLLFPGPFPDSHDMSFDEFSAQAAPSLVQNPRITVAMVQFFQYIWKRMASENMN